MPGVPIPMYLHHNRFGLWMIFKDNGGDWRPTLDGEELGSFSTAARALAALRRGRCRPNAARLATESCNLPAALEDWTFGESME